MKKLLALIIVLSVIFAAVLPAASAEGAEDQAKLTVSLRQGDYLGYELPNGVYAWRGIRYADAPLFQPPVPLPDKEEGAPVIEAFVNGPGTSGMLSAKEDCLDLTVFLNPEWDVEKDGPRSVFMWIFGSANMGGSLNARDGDGPAYDWSNFVKANPGIIVVTPTHRGGALGSIDLSVLPDYEDYKDANGEPLYRYANNIARLDILEVLKWINANIAAFGGNPNDVSIGGQSSGGNLCASVMMMPESKDLWQKALLQESFPLDASLMPLDEAKRVARNTYETLNIHNIPELLKFVEDNKDAVGFGAGLSSKNPANFGYKGQSPVIDDVVIRSNYFDQLLGPDGLWAGKKAIFGFNEGGYDTKYAKYMDDAPDSTAALEYHANSVSMGNLGPYGWYAHSVGTEGQEGYIENYAEYVIDQIKANSDKMGRDYYTAAKDLDEDLNIRLPAQLFAEAACDSADIYFYELTFNPSSEITKNRTAHGSENAVLMMTWEAGDRGDDKAADRQIVGDRIAGIWGAFIRTGDPNKADLGGAYWTPYKSGTRDTMLLGNKFEMVNGVRNDDIDVLFPIMREYSKLFRLEGKVALNADGSLDTTGVTMYPLCPDGESVGLPARASGDVVWEIVDTDSGKLARATVKGGITNVVTDGTTGYSLGVVTGDYVKDFALDAAAQQPPVTDPEADDQQPPTPPQESTATVYIVKRGDCLWNIAYKFYGTGRYFGDIAAANGIKAPYYIYNGQELIIPAK